MSAAAKSRKHNNTEGKLEKFLYFTSLGGLAACLFTPLILSVSTYFPFVVGKAVTFQIIVEIVLALYLLLNLITNKYRPRFNIISWCILAYFLAVTLSSIIGIDFKFSFWSNYERMDGLFNLYHFGIYFFLLTNLLKRRKDWLIFLRLLLVTFIIIDFFGLLQKQGIGFLAQFSGDRAFSTLGNATYLGMQAVFQIAVAAFLFFADKKLWWRVFYVLNGFLGVVAIFISKTRGGLLSSFVGVMVFLILSSLFSKKRKLFMGLFGGIVVAIGIFTFILSHSEWKITQMVPSRLNPLSGTFSLETRGVVWKITAEAWKEKKILGWGRSSNGFIFGPFYNPEAASFEDVWFDKPHNKILEVGVDSGIIGLLAYLSISGAAIYVLWKKRSLLGDGTYVLIALCVAYIVQGLFLFDFQASYLWWYTILGLVAFLAIKPRTERESSIETSQIYILTAIGLIFIGWALTQGSVRPFLAAQKGIESLKMQYRGEPSEKVLTKYNSALALDTFGSQEIIAEMVKPIGSLEGQLGVDYVQPYVEFAVKEADKNYENRPHDIKNALMAASLHRMNARFDGKSAERAREIYLDIIKRAPNHMSPYMQLAMVEYGAKNYDLMLQYFNQAIALNRNYYKSIFETARIYFIGGMREEGRRLMVRAINIPKFPWTSLPNANFLNEEDVNWFIDIYSRVVEIDDNWDYPHLIMAGLYGNLKDTDSMKYHLKKAIEISPGQEAGLRKMFGSLLDD